MTSTPGRAAMPAAPVVALLGCGGWGMNHVRVWEGLGRLRAVCDTDPQRLAAVRAAHPELGASPELAPILADPEIRGVVIATPATTHGPLALAALQAGKDVLVEKPMALSVAEGRLLVETARRLGRILQVGHVLEYHPAVRKLVALVAAGALGSLRHVHSNRLNLGRFRTEESALWSFAPHDVAVMLRLVGAMPEEVACHGASYLTPGVADVTLTSLRFPSGVQGHVFVSWLQPTKEHRTVVVGERQMAVFDDTSPWPEKLVLYPHRVVSGAGSPVGSRAKAVPVALDAREPLEAECEDFLSCIESRRSPLADGDSGLRVLEVLEAAQRSLEDGGRPRRTEGAGGWSTHPSAVVDPGADVGAGTRIWHYSHVMPGARIGRRCVVGQNVFVGGGAVIGDGVKIQNNVSVYDGVELEDEVFCGPSAVFTNVRRPRSAVDRTGEFEKTIVRRGATLGANCTIVCGVEVGRYAFVASGAVVTKDVPDHALVAGVPARVVAYVCRCGGPLSFDGASGACAECPRRYRRATDGRIQPA